MLDVIDITDWPIDEEFAEAYPEGARPKRTVFSPSTISPAYITPDWRHMFKRSSRRYPEQFWAEIVAWKIAHMLDVNAPPCYPAYDGNIGKHGALSPWFYEEGAESFFSAGNFFHKMVDDFDRDRGTQHNLLTATTFNTNVLGGVSNYEFWSALLYDSIIGNTDRHQDNWGHIVIAQKLSKSVAQRKGRSHNFKWKFAPWFDNGTSLGHEMLPGRFTQWNQQNLDSYINRGRHHIRHSLDDLSRVGHIESIEMIKKLPLRNNLLAKLQAFSVAELGEFLQQVVDLKVQDDGMLTQERADFMLRLTSRRIELSLDILNADD